MGFISFWAGSRPGPGGRRAVGPDGVSFQAASCPGTQIGGVLTLSYKDGGSRLLRVCMTWDALDRLRGELARNGLQPGDAPILHRVLSYWGVEEYGRRLEAGAALASEGLLLTFAGGPGSCEPRRLLVACGLMAGPA